MTEVPGAHQYVKVSCPGFTAFSGGRGSKVKQTYSVYPYPITKNTTAGTYRIKVHAVGTVPEVTYRSRSVSFTGVVT